MGQITSRPGTIFETDIEEQTKEKRFIKAGIGRIKYTRRVVAKHFPVKHRASGKGR